MKNNEAQELARQSRNKYAREWRLKNKDKVKEINTRYWMRRALKEKQEAVENGST